jgi:hypothetical protein
MGSEWRRQPTPRAAAAPDRFRLAETRVRIAVRVQNRTRAGAALPPREIPRTGTPGSSKPAASGGSTRSPAPARIRDRRARASVIDVRTRLFGDGTGALAAHVKVVIRALKNLNKVI